MFVRQIPEFHLFRVTDIQIGLLAERNTSAVSRAIEKKTISMTSILRLIFNIKLLSRMNAFELIY